jgi:hypothetical protein
MAPYVTGQTLAVDGGYEAAGIFQPGVQSKSVGGTLGQS